MFLLNKNQGRARSRRLVIGDVHGFFDPLLRLLDSLAPDADDQVYFLGDLIDRGTGSRQVVELVMANGYRCVLGNHEHMMLKAIGDGRVSDFWLQNWLYAGGSETLGSYGNRIPEEHIRWFKSLPDYLDLGDAWLVHAGVDPEAPLQQQTRDQFCWIRDKFHASIHPYFANKIIITGHTVTLTFPEVKPGKIVRGVGWLDIETGVYHPRSGWLTALDLTNQKVYQVYAGGRRCRVLPLSKATVTIDPLRIAGRLKKAASSEPERNP